MLNKNNFFKNFFFKSRAFSRNIEKTKLAFNSLKSDFKNFEIPLLQSYEKNYVFDFSQQTIKKFSKYKNIIVIGMGGSILGAKSIYSFFKTKIKKEVFFFDNLDSNLYLQFTKIKNLKNSCFVIISKSGNTLETIANLSIISSKFSLKNKLVIITESKNSALNDIANNLNAELIEHKNFIGGRYSALSEAGMFPAALMGLRIKNFKNFKKFINNKNFVSSLIQNVASIYTLNKLRIKNSVILNYNSGLNDLGYWYQQLIGESLGKKNKGINTILSSAPKDHHSVLQLYLDGPKDKFFTFFSTLHEKNKFKVSNKTIPDSMKFLKNKSLEFIIKAQLNATTNIFRANHIPFRKFVFKKKDEAELGMIFTFFVLEAILLGKLLNLNPFDQPAVEQVKIKTKNILSR